MAHKLERIDAKRLYCEENKDIIEIAKLIDVPESTVRRWKSEDGAAGNDWDKEREEILTTSFSAVKQMLRAATSRLASMVTEIQTTNKINPSEVYALRQLILSAKSLQKEIDNYGNIILAMTEFTEFMAERDHEELERLQPFLSEFGSLMSKKYRRK
ncbi:MAG: DUF1804 family protein [Bacteroidetes bacterium]|nr:DUF1804 family protein [Bacteroidota bacterium]